ncbi:MAG: chemotaxis response regulator protein-glutamate methylesterase [Rhodospirillales bacterium]|jgi:two-component system chemotaxis response regulator CheB|nr:chemotaxis response regulator protein-glutamate methylesterase [Rhodospirillales bacterium]
MIRAVIAAGSASLRSRVAQALAGEPDISVIVSVGTTREAIEATKRHKPDIVIIGIELPPQDGFEATKQIMIEAATPIAIVADNEDARQVEVSMRALRAGALTVLAVPNVPANRESDSHLKIFISDIKAMAQVKVVRQWRRTTPASKAPISGEHRHAGVIAIAASTGGPAALHRILSDLPGHFPVPILVVQHITPGFVDGFADWLRTSCPLNVSMAVDGATIKPHTVYLGPDGRHLGLSGRSTIVLDDMPAMEGFKPSASYLFQSVANVYRSEAIGVVLTGMGRDGVDGLLTLHKLGGHVIAQDEASSTVFGMPGTAIAAKVVHDVLPLKDIAAKLMMLVGI